MRPERLHTRRARPGTVAAVALSATIILAAVGPAGAVDLCIDFPFETIVAHRLRIPRANRCAPVLGHVTGLAGKTILVDGSACTDDRELRVFFSLTQHSVSPGFV